MFEFIDDSPKTPFLYEVTIFRRKHGDQEIEKSAWLIRSGKWFSWRLCFRRMHALKKHQRKDAFRLLRFAQKDRQNPDQETRNFRKFYEHGRPMAPTAYFEAPLRPEYYDQSLSPVLLNGAKVGNVVKTERLKGNRCRIYYRSQFHLPLELTSVKAVMAPWGERNKYFDSIGLLRESTEYHVKIKKALTRGAA